MTRGGKMKRRLFEYAAQVLEEHGAPFATDSRGRTSSNVIRQWNSLVRELRAMAKPKKVAAATLANLRRSKPGEGPPSRKAH